MTVGRPIAGWTYFSSQAGLQLQVTGAGLVPAPGWNGVKVAARALEAYLQTGLKHFGGNQAATAMQDVCSQPARGPSGVHSHTTDRRIGSRIATHPQKGYPLDSGHWEWHQSVNGNSMNALRSFTNSRLRVEISDTPHW